MEGKGNFQLSIVLDKRRKKANGCYPVKLQVYTNSPRKQKLFGTNFEFTESDFKAITSSKPPKKFKSHKIDLDAVLVMAKKKAQKINSFTIEEFEKQMFRNAGDAINISANYKETIDRLKRNDQISTANNYALSQKSLKEFVETKNMKFEKITFYDITPTWLKEYERFMVYTKGRSITTVSMYLRTLRTLFNAAIDANDISRDIYPFGLRKYQVPAAKNVKKALSKIELKTLFEAMPLTPQQEIAKDFWFFSYACNGMNMKDICLLRWKDIKYEQITFLRAKTKSTSRTELKPVVVPINQYIQTIIDKYGIKSGEEDQLIFNILQGTDNAEQQQAKIKNYTRFLNQHIKRLAVSVGLYEKISSNWARHSFATQSIRKGASMEFIQETLGHTNQETTQNYFAGFDNESKKEFAEEIMNFD